MSQKTDPESSKNFKSIDDIYKTIGQFGRYQIFIWVVASFSIIPSGIHNNASVFTQYTGWSWIDVRSEAQMPGCPDSQMPKCPDAKMPRCPEAQMSGCPEG